MSKKQTQQTQQTQITIDEQRAKIESLLNDLRACDSTQRNDKKRIRRMLRKYGHRGGLMHERASIARERDAQIANNAKQIATK